MANCNQVKQTNKYIGKVGFEKDILEELTSVCKEKNIKLGKVQLIGAVTKARVGYYYQDSREYKFIDFDKHMEILSLTGNISLKDGEPIIHAHITFMDEDGNAVGGHLAPGTIAFAGEFIIDEFEGPDLNRGIDEQTGLPLWNNL
ncbi:MAG: PPC domain-containing DNA-binding protein [Planctomycetota bacterium]|jgi:predicted DNA-binding protein with PD1-like motif